MKVRGVIVGQVKEADRGEGAVLTLGHQARPDREIPDNVTARILPKTLFGEKYVELRSPRRRRKASLKTGDGSTQTDLPIEVERVLNDLYPLLRAVQPAELNYTLNALATALEGRGDAIGENIETLDAYLKRLNPQVPALIADLRLLAGHRSLRRRAPEIADDAAQHREDRQHAGGQGGEAERLLQGRRPRSPTPRSVPGQQRRQHHPARQAQRAAASSCSSRYSPEFPCLLSGLVDQAPCLADTFRGFIFHIDLDTAARPAARLRAAGLLPVYGAEQRSDYAGLPNPKDTQDSPGQPSLTSTTASTSLQQGERPAHAHLLDRAQLAGGRRRAGTAQKALFNSMTRAGDGRPRRRRP